MTERTFRFDVDAQRRESTFFRGFFCVYPAVVFRDLFRRPWSESSILILFLFPPFLVRNLLAGFFSTQFCHLADYRLTLHETHLSFGVGDDRERDLAAGYGSVRTLFRAAGAWVALMHDGFFVFLPPGPEGDLAAEVVREGIARQAEEASRIR